MSDHRPKDGGRAKTADSNSTRKKLAYVKPAFEHEKVFETMALACGKTSPSQAACRFNRKNS